jgi:hypothetical protein
MRPLTARQLDRIRYSKNLLPPKREKISQMTAANPYGDGEVFTLMSVFVSVLVAGAGESLITVVLFSVLFWAGGLVTVVSFCSHAPSNATLASKQMYLIINGRRI